MNTDNLIENTVYYDKHGKAYKLLKFPFYCENEIWCLRGPDKLQPLQCFDEDFLNSLSTRYSDDNVSDYDLVTEALEDNWED